MDPDLADTLLSPRGFRLLEAARATRGLPPHVRVERLRAGAEAGLVRAALTQDDLRARAALDCPLAERLLFTREALEQASAWPVALERATRWPRTPAGPLADLGAGIGFDALAAASAGSEVVAYERDPLRARLLRENVRALGLEAKVTVRQGDFRRAPLRGPRAFLDPDRRPGGRRTRDPERFDPPRADWAALLAGFASSIVKVAPAPPRAGNAGDEPFEVVSLRGRARERRLFRGAFPRAAPRRALALPRGAAIEGEGIPWPGPSRAREGDWLLDPDPAVTLAGLVGDLARATGLRPLHPRIAYLVGPRPSARPVPGHWIRVEAVSRPRPREIQAWLDARGVGRLVVRTRGVAGEAAAWRKRFRLEGEEEATLVLSRGADDRWVALLGTAGTPAG